MSLSIADANWLVGRLKINYRLHSHVHQHTVGVVNMYTIVRVRLIYTSVGQLCTANLII